MPPSGIPSAILAHAPSHYRGRLAPSPTGWLHLGHARTFWTAQERARQAGGTLVLRNDDLDRERAQPQYVAGFLEDLRWFGFDWDEGPDVGGPFGPYSQSERLGRYADVLERLRDSGVLFPCTCSRRDLSQALSAPHAADDEVRYPGTCRDRRRGDVEDRFAWRFRVPDGDVVEFVDRNLGPQRWVAGRDFGDFVVWRSDGLPSYQLACVADDITMGITEVVRGADLLVSTARQLLLYRALGSPPPSFFHCPLMMDSQGNRLAKRHDALSLRTLRQGNITPEKIRAGWASAEITTEGQQPPQISQKSYRLI